MEIGKQTIGLFHDYLRDWTITVDELKTELVRGTGYTAEKYCDRRFNTNIERFNHDPYTGEKIDWKKIYEYLIS